MHAAYRAAGTMMLITLAGFIPAFAQAKSGLYGNLTLGLDGPTVTGVFSDARPGNGTDEAPQFSCLFALRGTLAGGSAAVTVWSPPDTVTTSGTLTLAGDIFRLKLQGEPPGCAATGDDFVSTPFDDSSVMSGTWTSARLVNASTADMHEAPVDGSSRKAMLSKGDVVVIYRRIGGWLEAEFFGGKHPVRGWLRESDVAPDHP